MKDFVTKANKTGGNDSGSATGQGAFEQNSLNDENKIVVTSTGQTLTAGTGADPKADQLARAITIIGQTAHSYQDSGVANAYTLTKTGSLVQPEAYIDGQRLIFSTANTNTGAATVNVSTLGVKTIVSAQGTALSGGEIRSGENIEIVYNHSNDRFEMAPWNVGLQQAKHVEFTASGSYVKANGLKYIIVEGVGGGGGSGGTSATGASSVANSQPGAGGGYARKVILASDLLSSETVTIGALGSGGSVGGTGSAGGTTSFGSHFSCAGGTGGSNGSSSSGNSNLRGEAGGIATGGDINIVGGNSSDSIIVGGQFASFGEGGSSPFGRGGIGAVSNDAKGYGAGAGCVIAGNSVSAQAGVDGSPGLIVITEFYGV